MKKIERLEKKFYDCQSKMKSALDDFSKEVVFSDEFDGDVPVISMAGDGELIGVWHERECPSNEIVRCMITRGYLKPTDFC